MKISANSRRRTVVQAGVRIGHRLLLLLQVAYQHLMLGGRACGDGEGRRARGVRVAISMRSGFSAPGDRPMFERRNQGFAVRSSACVQSRNIRDRRDQARLLDAQTQDGARTSAAVIAANWIAGRNIRRARARRSRRRRPPPASQGADFARCLSARHVLEVHCMNSLAAATDLQVPEFEDR